ncbi:glycosyltransferase [Pedobacter psychroterrae]|nr:glycosyltransferase [Pedobacter psychroterrae]
MESEGYQILIWDDESIGKFLLDNYEFAFDSFYYARNHAEAADVARYLIIYTYGGYYIDWDVELLDMKAFTALSLKHVNGYMLVDESNESIASEFFCACLKDEFLLNLSKDIAYLYESGKRDRYTTPQYSGPFRMRDSLQVHPQTSMESISLAEVFAYSYDEIASRPNKIITQPCIHYWLHSWM